ncbi:DUF3054 domain-containing protein [Dietzia psychralcaliphila]|uniref:DUF3054 family protein n=1 Tax=Dietzia psychralcaliphila TaxID=139021 RepID=A0AAD0JSY4_9ACTN|nr:DUF3054 domain-containing protein [Dietzia psychralcaliphila]AWH96669.1 hypothetical protein A6048_15545 [Dietzia psychralcaliphila]PTM89279.1 Protein of unknown function (DUF3054) [Dietzia psychralcaliphila]
MIGVALPLVFLLDAALVVVFATFGRGAHSEGLGIGQVWDTAWPFLVGLVLGWIVVLAARRDPSTVRSGVLVWITTLVGGMLIRGLGDGRVPHWSFILVAAIATAVFLVGWRAVRAALSRRRAA